MEGSTLPPAGDDGEKKSGKRGGGGGLGGIMRQLGLGRGGMRRRARQYCPRCKGTGVFVDRLARGTCFFCEGYGVLPISDLGDGFYFTGTLNIVENQGEKAGLDMRRYTVGDPSLVEADAHPGKTLGLRLTSLVSSKLPGARTHFRVLSRRGSYMLGEAGGGGKGGGGKGGGGKGDETRKRKGGGGWGGGQGSPVRLGGFGLGDAEAEDTYGEAGAGVGLVTASSEWMFEEPSQSGAAVGVGVLNRRRDAARFSRAELRKSTAWVEGGGFGSERKKSRQELLAEREAYYALYPHKRPQPHKNKLLQMAVSKKAKQAALEDEKRRRREEMERNKSKTPRDLIAEREKEAKKSEQERDREQQERKKEQDERELREVLALLESRNPLHQLVLNLSGQREALVAVKQKRERRQKREKLREAMRRREAERRGRIFDDEGEEDPELLDSDLEEEKFKRDTGKGRGGQDPDY